MRRSETAATEFTAFALFVISTESLALSGVEGMEKSLPLPNSIMRDVSASLDMTNGLIDISQRSPVRPVGL